MIFWFHLFTAVANLMQFNRQNSSDFAPCGPPYGPAHVCAARGGFKLESPGVHNYTCKPLQISTYGQMPSFSTHLFLSLFFTQIIHHLRLKLKSTCEKRQLVTKSAQTRSLNGVTCAHGCWNPVL